MIHPSAQPLPCLEALEPRLAPAGIVAVNVKGGVLTLTGDAENNNIEIYNTGGGVWGIRDSADAGTLFSLNGEDAVAEVLVTVTRGIKVDLQEGNDFLTLDSLSIGGPVTLKDKSGNDEIVISFSEINGSLKLDTGAGEDDIRLDRSTVNGLLSIKAGADMDSVTLGNGTYRGITVDFGTGSSFLFLGDGGDASVVQITGNVSIKGKSGAEDSTLSYMGAEEFLLTGSFKMKMGDGGNGLVMSSMQPGGSLVITGGLAYTGGAGQDGLAMEGSISIGGRLSLKMGQGDSLLHAENITSLTLGSLSYTGGTGENSLDLDGARLIIAGDALFKNVSPDRTEIDINFTDEIFIGRNLTVKGGPGTDLLIVETGSLTIQRAFRFTAGHGDTYLNLAPDAASLGSLTFKGGSGPSSVYLASEDSQPANTIDILGKTKFNFGKSPYTEAFLRNTNYHGSVTIIAATPLAEEGGNEELIALADSTFLGSLSIKSTGTQGGTLSLNNSTFQAAVTLKTGKGNTLIYLDNAETLANGSRSTQNVFEGPVKILLGAGDDIIIAGVLDGEADEGNLFNGPVFLDGGPGEDLNNSAPNRGNIYNGTLTEKNFEPPVV